MVGVDRSPGMLGLAGRRMPGGVVRGDATRLPFAAASVDAVVIVWLLHLLPDPEPVLAEAARVLRPGGVLITTVDKNGGYFAEDSDIARVTADLRQQYAPQAPDDSARVLRWAAERGLRVAYRTVFPAPGRAAAPAGGARRSARNSSPGAPMRRRTSWPTYGDGSPPCRTRTWPARTRSTDWWPSSRDRRKARRRGINQPRQHVRRRTAR